MQELMSSVDLFACQAFFSVAYSFAKLKAFGLTFSKHGVHVRGKV